MSFNRCRVLAFESRRANEIAELIRINGGEPFVAPALIEVPIEENPEALAFADRLYRDEFGMVIFLTGVGAKVLGRAIGLRDGEEALRAALRRTAVVVRGPKPSSVMREWNVPVAVHVPEPNTWRELLAAVENRPERVVAVQEYGRPNRDLLNGLSGQGRTVTSVPVYQWALPPDTRPLEQALNGLAAGEFQAALFTTGVQIEQFLDFAQAEGRREEALRALRNVFLGSIGPTCSESLRACGLSPSMEPSHPKMGLLVREAALTYANRPAPDDGAGSASTG
ncbi:MAG: uroporphyrinogen-III synthase [Acidobacteriaceae bacterium]|nr:uroporphyrinogen-III synthase [Acidobacteriaceae bacterium]